MASPLARAGRERHVSYRPLLHSEVAEMPLLLEKPVAISRDHYLLRIDYPGINTVPGQFANIRIGPQTDPLLRRPFSIHNQSGDTIEILFKAVGRGTRLLKESTGGAVDLLAPLGRGFTLIESGSVLLIGGGVGNAPLYYLASRLREKGNHITYLYGSKSSEFVYLKDRYDSLSDEFILATDDGTDGRRGLITDFIGEIIARRTFDIVYLCGPTAMMQKTVALLRDNPAPVEASIENYFGCGFGVCYGCSVETTEGLKRACIDGPVFDGKSIRWNST